MSVPKWLRRCEQTRTVPRGTGAPTPLTSELPKCLHRGEEDGPCGSGQGECWTKGVMKSLSESPHLPFRAHIGLHEEAGARTLGAA